jgi:hypothetical protein
VRYPKRLGPSPEAVVITIEPACDPLDDANLYRAFLNVATLTMANLPLFTRVRRINLLRTPPLRSSEKFADAEECLTRILSLQRVLVEISK